MSTTGRSRLLAILLLSAASLTGCASATAGGASSAQPTRYVLTPADLTDVGSMNVYEAIQKLRPEFLRTRGTSTMTSIPTPATSRGATEAPAPANSGSALPVSRSVLRVYVDDALLDAPTDLRNVGVRSVVEIRYVPGPEAGVRYGTNHSAGVIFVKTK